MRRKKIKEDLRKERQRFTSLLLQKVYQTFLIRLSKQSDPSAKAQGRRHAEH
ncbi:MAG: hypothetical protein ACI976_000769, partial [Aureispira sp.]